jgi:1-acyl-sn-glycerol-3-phosphate acyltransferase
MTFEVDKSTVAGEARADIWMRRAISVPAVYLGFLVVIVTAPFWILIAFCVDLANAFRTATLRTGLFLTVYLGCEAIGVAASFGFWVADVIGNAIGNAIGKTAAPEAKTYYRRHLALQRWWAGTLLKFAIWLFRLKIRAEGCEVLDTPMILMIRHASIADALLANEFVGLPHGIHLRYVMKRELLIDPCLDIVGHRLPNYFVDRDSDDPSRKLAGMVKLLSGLGEDEGVLIYPEGTRFTEQKRQRVIERFSEQGKLEMAARARALRHTLPPRLGGPLALLEANPGLDVVFCAHTGFETAGQASDLLDGSMLDREIAVRFWRVPLDDIPIDPSARSVWLYDYWQKIDDWIESNRAPVGRVR